MGADPISIFMSVASLATGASKMKAYSDEARALKSQAELVEQEAFDAAEDTRESGRRIMGEQALSYIRAGLVLEGSPLQVLEDTEMRSEESAESIVKRGRAQSSLLRKKARSSKALGNASLFGGLMGASAPLFDQRQAHPAKTLGDAFLFDGSIGG